MINLSCIKRQRDEVRNGRAPLALGNSRTNSGVSVCREYPNQMEQHLVPQWLSRPLVFWNDPSLSQMR